MNEKMIHQMFFGLISLELRNRVIIIWCYLKI